MHQEKPMNDPIPYKISAEDVDEVLSAYGVRDEIRDNARMHVMRRLPDIDDVVRTIPEDFDERREMALAEIEDILINDGYIEASANETRIYPTPTGRSD